MYKYEVAKTEEEKKEIFAFLQSIYDKKGYHSDHGHDKSFGQYLLLPKSKVFTASVNGKLFGTISVVPDSENGLPMDVLNKVELEQFRKSGKRIAEVTQYAVDKDVIKMEDKSFSLIEQYTSSFPLFNLVIHYAFYLDLDYLVIATTPEHATFYKTLGFEQISEKKYYPSVNTWGVAQSLDIKSFKEKKVLPGIMGAIARDIPDYKLFD